MRQRHAGFTLLEMVIVVAIIGLLIGIGFVGFGAIRGSQEKRTTRGTLEIARNMLNAYVTAGQSGGNNLQGRDAKGNAIGFYAKLAPPDWQFNETTYSPMADPDVINYRKKEINTGTPFQQNYEKTIDYYNVPRRQNDVGSVDDPSTGLIVTGTPVPMNVPLVEAGEPKQWVNVKSWQLMATMKTIRRLRGNPDARAIWSTLRESQVANVPDPATGKNLQQDFILDAWGHPILFVPGSGVRAVRYGKGPIKAGDPPPSYVKADPTDAGQLEFQGIRSPDGRAFWMSAGPDGYYDTQDDNLYSFDN